MTLKFQGDNNWPFVFIDSEIFDKNLNQVGRNFENKDAAVTALDNMKVAAHFKTKEWVPTALVRARTNIDEIGQKLSDLERAKPDKITNIGTVKRPT